MKNKIIALLLLINFISCKTDDPHLNQNISAEITQTKRFNLLVFLKKKKAVKSIELKRNLGDFENIYDTLILQKDANFILVGEIFSDNPALFKLNKK